MHILEKYIRDHDLNLVELGDILNYDAGNLSRIINGKLGISAKLAFKIKEKLNLDIEANKRPKRYNKQGKDNKTTNAIIKDKPDNIDASFLHEPDTGADYVKSPKASGFVVHPEHYREYPFISVQARASFNYEYFTDNIHIKDTYRVYEPVSDARYAKKRIVIIETNGDSMAPTIPDTSKAKAFEVDKSDWAYTTGVIAINYYNHFEVKRIRENTLHKTGTLMLHSDNPTGGIKEVRIDDIIAIWKVFKIVDADVY